MIDHDQLHNWLYGATKTGSMTVIELMDEIRIMRVGGIPLPALPTEGISMQQALEKLERDGKATRQGSYWRWAQGKPATAKEAQNGLF